MLWLWIKAIHIAFMVTWFAGLFYLPRLFVYHSMCDEDTGSERFKVMERKLFVLMSMGGILTAIFGIWLLTILGWQAIASSGWLHLKLFLVTCLIGYHLVCAKYVADFRKNNNQHGHVFYRWFNEVPVLFLFGILILVVVKPF